MRIEVKHGEVLDVIISGRLLFLCGGSDLITVYAQRGTDSGGRPVWEPEYRVDLDTRKIYPVYTHEGTGGGTFSVSQYPPPEGG